MTKTRMHPHKSPSKNNVKATAYLSSATHALECSCKSQLTTMQDSTSQCSSNTRAPNANTKTRGKLSPSRWSKPRTTWSTPRSPMKRLSTTYSVCKPPMLSCVASLPRGSSVTRACSIGLSRRSWLTKFRWPSPHSWSCNKSSTLWPHRVLLWMIALPSCLVSLLLVAIASGKNSYKLRSSN
jgi:hypothetical protein